MRIALASFLLATTAAAQLAPRYTLTRVNPFFEFNVGGGVGLTDNGFVAASFNEGFETAFAWTVGTTGGSSAELLLPAPSGIAWTGSRAVAVNAAGVIVGHFTTEALAFDLARGFRFQGGASVELFGPEGTAALPSAINADGWIVGTTLSTSGRRAVLWSPALVASYLDPLELAHDINDARVVLGSVATLSVERAVLWQAGVVSELGDLEPLQDVSVQAAALNNHGDAVGHTRLGGREVAFRWTSATGMTQLAPFPDPMGGPDQARDINDAGWVIGLASGGGTFESVLWSPANELHGLRERVVPPLVDPFTLNLLAGFRLNSAGQIAASANRHFQTSWVLLTPALLGAVAPAPAVAGTPYVVDVSGAQPGKTVFLVGAGHDPEERGYRVLPGGPLGLSMPTPRFAARALADASGNARLVWNVPSSAAGQPLRLQAFQLAPTRVSNLLRETP